MQDMGEGRLPWPSQGSWGPGLGPRRKVFECVRVSVRVSACAHLCVFPTTTIPCVCMHVFVKKKKTGKKI